MGTHPTNPSKVYGSEQLLSAYLSDKKDLLGAAKGFEPPFDGHKAEEGHVPFLFKILCANQGQSTCLLGKEVADLSQLFHSRFIQTRSCPRSFTEKTRSNFKTRITNPRSPSVFPTGSWDSPVSVRSKRLYPFYTVHQRFSNSHRTFKMPASSLSTTTATKPFYDPLSRLISRWRARRSRMLSKTSAVESSKMVPRLSASVPTYLPGIRNGWWKLAVSWTSLTLGMDLSLSLCKLLVLELQPC
jgi:hypothetical protein